MEQLRFLTDAQVDFGPFGKGNNLKVAGESVA